jgi:hypothetical protein
LSAFWSKEKEFRYQLSAVIPCKCVEPNNPIALRSTKAGNPVTTGFFLVHR